MTPMQTVDVPSNLGYTLQGSCGNQLGVIDLGYWAQTAFGLMTHLSPTNALTIFVTYDMAQNFMGGNPRPLSGIGVNGHTDQTFLAGTYTEPNAFIKSSGGISSMSSGLASWMDDPFILSNDVPAWKLPFKANPPCSGLLWANLPVLGHTFPVVQGGVRFDVGEATFLSWFARETPSKAVDGWYSLDNTLKAAPPVCH